MDGQALNRWSQRHAFMILLLMLIIERFGMCADAQTRDFIFFTSSDPHIGLKAKKGEAVSLTPDQPVRDQLKGIAEVIGQAYPAVGALRSLPPANVAQPLGFLIAGDLTDNGDDPLQWPRFDEVFPVTGLEDGKIPLYLSAGNHDGSPEGASRKGIVARNQQAAKAGRINAVSENGLHYAWSWQGVHFICMNLCPADSTDAETPFQFGKPGPGSWNDPLNALKFLTEYLKTKVGTSGEPVIIWHHYGYCEGFNFDWNWWSAKQRREFYEVIKPYNVAALLHGHTHAPAHYWWPDPKSNPKEIKRLFGEAQPEDLKTYEVFSGGSIRAGTFFVIRIVGNQLIAAHRSPRGWTNDESMVSVKSIESVKHVQPVK